jgi:hypothetical protein
MTMWTERDKLERGNSSRQAEIARLQREIDEADAAFLDTYVPFRPGMIITLRLRDKPTSFDITNVFLHDMYYRRSDEPESTVQVRFLANAFNEDGTPNKKWYSVDFMAYYSVTNGNRWIVMSEKPGDPYGISTQA